MRILALIIAASLLVGCSHSPSGDDDAPLYPKLAMVKVIYIGDFGTNDGADLIREKLRSRLLGSKRFTIVEDKKTADAVLTGMASVNTRYSANYYRDSGGGNTSYSANAVLRLVSTRTNDVIWITEKTDGKGHSVSSSVSDNVYKQLHSDAERVDKANH